MSNHEFCVRPAKEGDWTGPFCMKELCYKETGFEYKGVRWPTFYCPEHGPLFVMIEEDYVPKEEIPAEVIA